ncbi:hypothetical protein Y032_0455g1767 [Ancylostoma ceylanicum]|uniref:Uncharacterized protein n=1 Tax=Ancylostoma ceylanicum TaxID=53326 RepID=A0A016WYI7_9BILA|nr:hypothetical protein Y032_0455g1767 [Ancylostoma ceylanicum]
MQRRKKPHPHYVGVKKYGKLLQEQKIRKEMAREHLRRLYNRIDEVVDVEEGRQRRATHLRQHRSKQFQSHNRTAKHAVLKADVARGQYINGITIFKKTLQERMDIHTWQAISNRNQKLCSQIRKREKAKMQKKLVYLRSHQPCRSYFLIPDAIPPDRCTIIGTDKVDDDMKAVLNLGPSFAVATAVDQELLNSVRCGFYKFAYQARWRENSPPTVMERITSFTTSIPFPRAPVSTPKPAPSLEPALASLQLNIMQAYARQSKAKLGSNLTERERRGLKKLLRPLKELRYSISDEGGDFVVLPQTLDKKISRGDLSDTTMYERSSLRAFDKVSSDLKSSVDRRFYLTPC